MIVERSDSEILIKISSNISERKFQSILRYLRYEELTSDSNATEEQIDELISDAKKGRWEKIKTEISMA